jgi:hypothetical protein
VLAMPASSLCAASAIQAAEVAAAYEDLRVSRFGLPHIPPAVPQPRPPSFSGHARFPQQGGGAAQLPQEGPHPLAPDLRQHLASLTPDQVTVEQVELLSRDIVALSRHLPHLGGPSLSHFHLLTTPTHSYQQGEGHRCSSMVRVGDVPHLMAEWRELLRAVQAGGR